MLCDGPWEEESAEQAGWARVKLGSKYCFVNTSDNLIIIFHKHSF